MDDSSLVRFVERLKTDEALRQRVIAAERAFSSNIKRDTDAITQIAAEAGYDITGWTNRPDETRPTPTDQELRSFRSCCWVVTSTI
jgi:hypothetical protein